MQQGDYLKIPETGDRGSVFCPALSENMETLDAHTHDGINSPHVKTSSLSKETVTIVAGDFASQTDGDYKYNLTLPIGMAFDTSMFKFIIASGADLGKEIFPTVNKTDDNKLDILIYTNTFNLKVVIF